MRKLLFEGKFRKEIRRHTHLHGKRHYTIDPQVNDVWTTKKMVADGHLGAGKGFMSVQNAPKLDEMSCMDFAGAPNPNFS